MLQEGIRLQHVARDTTVPMYRTNLECVPAGRFKGNMVVSMRPLSPADAIRAVQITSRFPAVHGAPVHLGMPEAIGIKDIMRPDFGDPPEMRSGELPVFWGCGVTSAGGDRSRAPVALHHAQAWLDADHRPEEQLAGGALILSRGR